MTDAVTDETPGGRGATDHMTVMVVRSVAADMAGVPVDRVYRVLNARLHASGAAPDEDEIWAHATAISDGSWTESHNGR
jgi:hypothetical protein